MKTKDLRIMSDEDLAQKEKTLKKDLFGLNYQRKIGQIEKPHQFQVIKKDIARILTILNERKSNAKS